MGTPCGAGHACDGAGKCITCPKATCADYNATCGEWPDNCGIPVKCDDGVKDGSETDIDCGGGGGCKVSCKKGQGCLQGSDCLSNACAMGVCQ